MKTTTKQRLSCMTQEGTRVTAVVLSILLIFTFGLAVDVMAEKPHYGGKIRSTAEAKIRSLDPHQASLLGATMISCNTYNTLLRWNRDLTKIELDLAESWRQVDPLTYEFKIHKGVRFHDVPPVNGREVTSEDVKYSIERMTAAFEPKKKLEYKHRYFYEGKMESIETPDKYTIIFKTKKPYAPFINYIASSWSAIVPREVVDEFGDLKRKSIGSGPFILKEHVRGSHLLLEKNPNYFKKGLPYVDQIHLRIMGANPAVTLSAFLAGDLDIIMIYQFQIPTVKKEAPDATITKKRGMNLFYFRCAPPWFDEQPLKPPFDSIKVRQALGMAVDKKKLLNLATGGHGTVQVGPVPNWSPYSLTEADQVEYNPEKAKKLLAEAGYPNGFSSEMITWSLPYCTKPAQIIQAMLKDVGVNVQLNVLEKAQYFNRTYHYKYNMSLHGGLAAFDPADYLAPYFGEKASFYRWNNKEIWGMIDEQYNILDTEKRAAKIQEIQRRLIEDSPNLFLYTMYRYHVYKPYVFPKESYLNRYQQYTYEDVWMAGH